MAAAGPAAGAVLAREPLASLYALSMNKPVVIGSSTGVTQALEMVLTALPGDSPGLAMVQHMPEKLTAMYAQRMDGLCAMNVREGKDGDRLERGVVLIAPGGRHMQLRNAGGQYCAVVADGRPDNRHKPSVDVLFRLVAECSGRDALAIMLTGMGDDDARGMKQLHDGGARTIAQDEASGVVFGMPKESIKLVAIDHVLPLGRVGDAILQFDSRGWAQANLRAVHHEWNTGLITALPTTHR